MQISHQEDKVSRINILFVIHETLRWKLFLVQPTSPFTKDFSLINKPGNFQYHLSISILNSMSLNKQGSIMSTVIRQTLQCIDWIPTSEWYNKRGGDSMDLLGDWHHIEPCISRTLNILSYIKNTDFALNMDVIIGLHFLGCIGLAIHFII